MLLRVASVTVCGRSVRGIREDAPLAEPRGIDRVEEAPYFEKLCEPCSRDMVGAVALTIHRHDPQGMMAGQNTYELTYIVNAVLNDDHIKDIVGRVNKFVTDHGGEVLETDEWGTRRLAYPINKRRNGYYVNVYFQAGGEMIPRLERALEIEDDVMRYLTLRFDSKMERHYEQQKASAVRPRGQAIESAPRPARKTKDEDESDEE